MNYWSSIIHMEAISSSEKIDSCKIWYFFVEENDDLQKKKLGESERISSSIHMELFINPAYDRLSFYDAKYRSRLFLYFFQLLAVNFYLSCVVLHVVKIISILNCIICQTLKSKWNNF